MFITYPQAPAASATAPPDSHSPRPHPSLPEMPLLAPLAPLDLL